VENKIFYDCAVLASNKLISLEKNVNKIRNEEFPSKTAREAIDLISKIITILKAKLGRYINEIRNKKTESSKRSLYKNITLIGLSAVKLTRLLKYIEETKVENNPWGMVEVVESFCKTIIPNIGILIRPQWRYKYEYINLVEEIQKAVNYLPEREETEEYTEFKEIFKSVPDIFILSFPFIERENILQNTAWTHEIGHILDLILFKPYKTPNSEINSFSAELVKNHEFNSEETEELLKLELKSIDPKKITSDLKSVHRDDQKKILIEIFSQWMSEVTADFFSIYLLGLAPLFTLADVGLSTHDPDFYDKEHPSLRMRLKLMVKYIKELGYIDILNSTLNDKELVKKRVIGEIDKIQTLCSYKSTITYTVLINKIELVELEKKFVQTLENALESSFDKIINMIKEKLKCESVICRPNALTDNIWGRIMLLKDKVPPNEIKEEELSDTRKTGKPISQLALILNAGWFYWITYKPVTSLSYKKCVGYFKEYVKINRLILKALQSFYVQNEYIKRKKEYIRKQKKTKKEKLKVNGNFTENEKESLVKNGALSKNDIIDRIQSKSLIISPILNLEGQVDACSFDIRLGNEFIITRRTKAPSIDANDPDIEKNIEQYQSKIYVPLGEALALHPQQFVIGSTLEYFMMPSDLCSIVVGKSSWGRLGLVIATATKVDPNFRGVITLELVNAGDIPIKLYPCAKIGQLVFFDTTRYESGVYKGKYDCPTGPGFSKIYRDDEWKFLFKQ